MLSSECSLLKGSTSDQDGCETVPEVLDHSISKVVPDIPPIPKQYFFECFSLEEKVSCYDAISVIPSPLNGGFNE